MIAPEDVVWNTITASAKTRFDYTDYESAFAELDNENAAENILFMIIAGYAGEQSVAEIVSNITTQLLVIGYSWDRNELHALVTDLQDALRLEILATQQALEFFDMGLKPPGVLVQVRSILGGK